MTLDVKEIDKDEVYNNLNRVKINNEYLGKIIKILNNI